jgi:hypothetical protein
MYIGKIDANHILKIYNIHISNHIISSLLGVVQKRTKKQISNQEEKKLIKFKTKKDKNGLR